MKLKLDKLEETILELLKEQTGKSEEDIIKLALYELNRKFMEDKVQTLPVPVPYPVYPNPITPNPPTYPWDTTPWQPYKFTSYPPTYPWDTTPWQPYKFTSSDVGYQDNDIKIDGVVTGSTS